MLVDDTVSLTTTMSFILKRRGYDPYIAKDGPEAIALVVERPYDMIFMDIKMPVMNGVETFRRIKEIRPDAPVMMMTAYAVEDLVEDALREGAYGIVYKPLDMEKMMVIIEEVKQSDSGALVMVVDDDQGLRVTFRNILQRRGFTVALAATGEQAIALAGERTFDAVFIDIKLPTINGLQTYLAIREIHPQVVAIIMTAYRQEVDSLVEEALLNSAYTCLYKPLDMTTVLGLIEEVMERKQSG